MSDMLYPHLGQALDRALSFGLSSGLETGLNACWFMGFCSSLLACLLRGGLAVWRHLVLRFLFWRSKMLPWRVIPFLEDATTRILLRRVGSGYSFPHRLLLDYFADLPQQKP